MITSALIASAMNYTQYKILLEELLLQGKTTGLNQGPEYLGYARINLARMQRLEKTTVLTDELKASLAKIQDHYTWLVLTEGWCGDAAQNLPVLRIIEKECPRISLKLLLRDEHPEIMSLYLTNGTRSIPKLICFENSASAAQAQKEIFTWGPRPAPLQEIVLKLKNDNAAKADKNLTVQSWYNADKTRSTQKELLTLVRHLQ